MGLFSYQLSLKKDYITSKKASAYDEEIYAL